LLRGSRPAEPVSPGAAHTSCEGKSTAPNICSAFVCLSFPFLPSCPLRFHPSICADLKIGPQPNLICSSQPVAPSARSRLRPGEDPLPSLRRRFPAAEQRCRAAVPGSPHPLSFAPREPTDGHRSSRRSPSQAVHFRFALSLLPPAPAPRRLLLAGGRRGWGVAKPRAPAA